MPTIRFEGASDDLIEVAGPCFYEGKIHPEGEEWSVRVSHDLAAKIVLCDQEGAVQMRVFALYADGGCWTFAVGLSEEGKALPDWPVRIGQGRLNEYTLALEVDVPEGVHAILLVDWEEREAQRRRIAESYASDI